MVGASCLDGIQLYYGAVNIFIIGYYGNYDLTNHNIKYIRSSLRPVSLSSGRLSLPDREFLKSSVF